MLVQRNPLPNYIDIRWVFDLLEVVEGSPSVVLHDGLCVRKLRAEVRVIDRDIWRKMQKGNLGDGHREGGLFVARGWWWELYVISVKMLG